MRIAAYLIRKKPFRLERFFCVTDDVFYVFILARLKTHNILQT